MNPAEEQRAQIVEKLSGIAHTRRILLDRELASHLKDLELLTTQLEAANLQSDILNARLLVLRCCVITRMFIDLLHTRFLLQGAKGIDDWRMRFGDLISRISSAAALVVEHLQPSTPALAEQTEHYRSSMECRKNLAVKLGEGMDATPDLLEDLKEKSHMTVGQPSVRITQEDELQLEDPDAEAVTALFFLWKAVRVLRHKLLFAAVEMSHEAGPWLESIQDHIKINENSTDLAIELERECHHPALKAWPKLAREVLDHVQMNVGLVLRRIFNRAEARGPLSSMHTDQQEVPDQIHSLARVTLQAYADLQALEIKIGPAVKAHLKGMDTLWEDCSVKQKDLAGLVLSITQSPGSVDEDELPVWIDAVLQRGWSLPPPLECPESVALLVFRHYAERKPDQVGFYIQSFLDLPTAPTVLAEHVALMFCGALFRIAKTQRRDLPRWDQWQESAMIVASKQLAAGYSTAGRVALTAALITLSFQVAEDTECMAGQLRTSLSRLRETLLMSTPRPERAKIGYFAQHLLMNLESWPWKEPSCLRGLLDDIAKTGIQSPLKAEEELVENYTV